MTWQPPLPGRARALTLFLDLVSPFPLPQVETDLEPLALLDELQAIERDMGRRKLIDKGPRNIDLDILLYGNHRIDHQRLRVPHVGIPEREFVLRPLAQSVTPSGPAHRDA